MVLKREKGRSGGDGKSRAGDAAGGPRGGGRWQAAVRERRADELSLFSPKTEWLLTGRANKRCRRKAKP